MPLGCDTCYNYNFYIGPNGIVVPSLFTPGSQYYLWLQYDTFQGTLYKVLTTINPDSSFYIVPNNYPQGLFSEFAGFFTIWMTSDSAGNDLVTIPMGVSPELYCLTFQIGGSSGYSGCSGSSGNLVCCQVESNNPECTGLSGFSGFSGTSGYSGLGLSGYSGTSGASGTSGFSGASGSNAESPFEYAPVTGSGQDIIIPVLGNNTINSTGSFSSILGGENNNIQGPTNTNVNSIAGGYHNVVYGNGIFVGGGYDNVVGNSSDQGSYSAIGGGALNKIYSLYGFIGAGEYNSISGALRASVVGGLHNSITSGSMTSARSIIGGGQYNSLQGPDSFIGGGQSNTINATSGGGGGTQVIGGGNTTYIGPMSL
jgi:hypothetical protein